MREMKKEANGCMNNFVLNSNFSQFAKISSINLKISSVYTQHFHLGHHNNFRWNEKFSPWRVSHHNIKTLRVSALWRILPHHAHTDSHIYLWWVHINYFKIRLTPLSTHSNTAFDAALYYTRFGLSLARSHGRRKRIHDDDDAGKSTEMPF